ncbi:hypothetical protein [Stenotrophomonas sp. 9(2022)]|uniref:hypothetical protein n=1 Tax=Stenotrophomonas sp. 9(2022) TaxID=2950153 RepID=UPI0021153AB3|nr:hypothetical protein [Stenotrophomonas sp. 9(2022)]
MHRSYADHDFDWMPQLEKTVVNSLVTSFGLDFLLLQDKQGGDVDTIHNARQGHYASDAEKQRYDERGDYDSTAYHTHSNYKRQGASDKASHLAGELNDPYRGTTMRADDKRALDHVIAAKEVHHDAGRVLAGLDGVELANRSSNLQSTHETINASKGAKPVDAFLVDVTNTIKSNELKIASWKRELATMPRDTPEQQHQARTLEAGIAKVEKRTETLKEIDHDGMRKRDEEAREKYEREVNIAYYTGSRFLKSTAYASANVGLRMGLRQVLGLIASEVWFELRAKLPSALKGLKRSFTFERFLRRVSALLHGIWRRVQRRFRDFITEFGDAFLGGVAASITTTVINIFARSAKNAAKIIREMWGALVKSIKIMCINPGKLGDVDQKREALAALTVGAGAVAASLVLAQLGPLAATPVVGGPLTSFVAALISGVVTLGLTWTLLHSPLAAKLWDFMARSAHVQTLADLVEANRRLDTYLMELAALELNVDPCAMVAFAADLTACNAEFERSLVLAIEIERRGIELPFQVGNAATTRAWLSGLAKT